MIDQGSARRMDRSGAAHLGRRRLMGASALTAAGWIAGGGRLDAGARAGPTPPDPIKMGIATDITGAIAPSRQRQLAGGAVHRRADQQGRRHRRPPIELFLEDTASDPKIAVGNVRKLIQERKVDVVLGGITSAMRQAIKDPIVNRGPHALHLPAALRRARNAPSTCTAPAPRRHSSATS